MSIWSLEAEQVTVYEVQKLLGHSSISVTQVYSHLAASELHGAVNKIQVVMNCWGVVARVVRRGKR